MGLVTRFSFITKYLVVIMAMTIVPNNILSSHGNANNSTIITFQEKTVAKGRMPEGM